MSGSRHVSQVIHCPAGRACSYVRDPANLPAWAAGVGDDMTLEFVPRNALGVLDHTVVLPDGGRGRLRGRVHVAPAARGDR